MKELLKINYKVVIKLLNVKMLALIFPERSLNTLYKMIRELKAKYQLRYTSAEIPINIVAKEYGISTEIILALIKKAVVGTTTKQK